MLATAPLVSLLDVILALLLGRNPFSFSTGAMANVMITLFLLTMNGVMVGGISQMREIVKEQEVYKRERLVNLQILPYVLSKVWVAALLGLYQAAVYTIVHYLAFDMPGGPVEFFQVYITADSGNVCRHDAGPVRLGAGTQCQLCPPAGYYPHVAADCSGWSIDPNTRFCERTDLNPLGFRGIDEHHWARL